MGISFCQMVYTRTQRLSWLPQQLAFTLTGIPVKLPKVIGDRKTRLWVKTALDLDSHSVNYILLMQQCGCVCMCAHIHTFMG